MMELIKLVMLALFALLATTMLLRKVIVRTTALTDNAGSFVNQTADRLHMRKLVGRAGNTTSTSALGDVASSSFDEIPIGQSDVNNSRAHIAEIDIAVTGATGAIRGEANNVVLTFERGQLFLDPDEAWFVNNTDIAGAGNFSFGWNIWYED